jgi:hypothetical protein
MNALGEEKLADPSADSSSSSSSTTGVQKYFTSIII